MIITSRFLEHVITGTRADIVRVYEGLGYGAKREGDERLSQLYFNHAEHYKK